MIVNMFRALIDCKKFQGYYREGVALQCLGRHAEALAAFSSGLAQVQTIPLKMIKFEDCNGGEYDDWIVNLQDPKSLQLLAGLVEAAMKSPLRGEKLLHHHHDASIGTGHDDKGDDNDDGGIAQ